MPSMNITEFFQHGVTFPYGVIRRVSAPVGTLFFLFSRHTANHTQEQTG